MKKKRSISLQELEFYTRQMSALLNAGVTLEKTLNTMALQSQGAKSEIFIEVKKAVKQGHTLAKALSNYPKDFPEVYIGLVSVGELSGNLSLVLKKLAVFLESSNSFKQGIISSLAYPLIVIFVSLMVVILLMTYIVPQIVDVLVAQERDLPAITILLIVISQFIRDWGMLLIMVSMTLFLLFSYLYSLDNKFKYIVDTFLLKLPVVGNFIKLGESALFASTMQIAISGGVSMIKSLNISSRVIGNKKLKESLKEVMSLVREGAELGRSLGKVDQFSPLLVQLISTGEKSGELIGMLEVVSTQLTNQLKQKALRFTVFIEPLMILFMGGIVLLIVLAVMMPLIEMNSML
ncbi:MAG: hypothetical protein CBC01_07990 [Betaproteobacteria bacterium TMED41]|nr:MAG: hypothetical protein CBC01_07990 [Betaproteobacteria bacterium TMED41]